jgi:hypothetical protein
MSDELWKNVVAHVFLSYQNDGADYTPVMILLANSFFSPDDKERKKGGVLIPLYTGR